MIDHQKITALFTPDKRPKSAPNTPDRKQVNKIEKPSTPGPNKFRELSIPHARSTEISAYYLGLCSEQESRTARIPSFQKLFSWNRTQTPQWRNDADISLHESVAAMIIVYRLDTRSVNRELEHVRSVSVCHENQRVFQHLSIKPTKRMKSSKYSYHYPDPRFVLEIPFETARGYFKNALIQFENPSIIKEVVILKHNLKFLELAGVVPLTIFKNTYLLRKQTAHNNMSPPRILKQQNHSPQKQVTPQLKLIAEDTNPENSKENKPQFNSNLVSQVIEGILKRKNTDGNTSRNVCTIH